MRNDTNLFVLKLRLHLKRNMLLHTGRLSSNTQTAYILALSFGIMPEEFKETASSKD